jgi:hypothetical protein
LEALPEHLHEFSFTVGQDDLHGASSTTTMVVKRSQQLFATICSAAAGPERPGPPSSAPRQRPMMALDFRYGGASHVAARAMD